ncbi:hypothetical protein EKO27_g10640 [Xylaria grammica]|uniref:Nephrocystin 3-like N-terminal domain-containing protein n=1 Tax=Xylaria grammica TaxID=363999 RepID=A0A439CQP0_9PEZI|nr:hypothetical protein EKO27_g10640 [Xylaria grammica]
MDLKVFRLQQIPINVDRRLACELMSAALGIESASVLISSLARSVNPFNPTKVATLTFSDASHVRDILEKPRPGSNVIRNGDEWCITVQDHGHNEPVKLIMDTHFKGLTPLHDPEPHEIDCIAISGLASHPFGSWQPKGSSKSYMWIRDDLPRLLPDARPIIYGYDTTLQDRNSFQLVGDLSLELIHQLSAHGWSSVGCKPLVFLAHSLGGIVLKQAIVIASDKLDADNPIVRSVQGAVFFGTPNHGMEQSHLMALVKGQYNEQLVADLSPNSIYLQQLDKQFTGLSFLRQLRLYWCYETKASPTVICDPSGKWTRAGPEHILVSRTSATRRESKLDMVIPINEDHSAMVKFPRNSQHLIIVAHKLKQIAAPVGHLSRTANGISDTSTPLNTQSLGLATTPEDDENNDRRKEQQDLDLLIASLRTPDENQRLGQVEERFLHTFDWIYDLEETRFSHWLQSGTGLFWINGKPGSGKSTLMKFIYQDRRTHELVDDWKKDRMVRAAFFFHHRGNMLQKSFVGLLRSILFQIVSQRRDLVPAFPRTLGFSIQNFTRADIQDYCLGSIRAESVENLEELIPNIVSRANGVFLWVKLVTKELANATKNAKMSREELKKHLDAFPTELDDYYTEIIKRIPYTNRWKTDKDGHSFNEFAHQQLTKYGGGLVEVVGDGIQVLHQTVEDFVKDPKFKGLVLGEQAKITPENGYTFLAKTEVAGFTSIEARAMRHGDFVVGRYLRSAEQTTGRSMKTFLDSVPGYLLKDALGKSTSITTLAYAATACLCLYIMESLDYTPNLLRDTKETLLTDAFLFGQAGDFEGYGMSHDHVSLTRVLLDNGFTLDKDRGAFRGLMQRINLYPESRFPMILDIVRLFVQYGQHLNIRVTRYYSDAECTPLHASIRSASLIRFLLDRGVDVNALDGYERTPLDCVLYDITTVRSAVDRWSSESLSVLLQRGGRINKTGRKKLEQCLSMMSEAGIETRELRFETMDGIWIEIQQPQLGSSSPFAVKFGKPRTQHSLAPKLRAYCHMQ